MRMGLSGVTALSALSFTTMAIAADLPTRKSPGYYSPQPVALWSGFYVGLNAGGTFSESGGVNTTAADLFDGAIAAGARPGAAFAASAAGLTPLRNGGFIGGGQVGYNAQLNRSFVLGLEADIQGLSGGASANSVGFGFDPVSGASPVTMTQAQKRLDYLGTVRGRVGFILTPTLLLYATGGLAYGDAKLSTSLFSFDAANIAPPGFGAGSFSNTLVGWTAGGGMEWLFRPQWSLKVEYLYYDLGGAATPGLVLAGVSPAGLQWAYGASNSTRFNGHIVRAGVDYHFNWSAPSSVIAKY